MYHRLMSLAALLGVFLLLANAMAHSFYWYVSVWWFDMLMHTIGGVFVTIVAAALLWRRHVRMLPIRETYITLLLSIFIIALAWEYYEYALQIYSRNDMSSDIADSLSDIVCGMIGGTIATRVVLMLKRRYNRSNGSTTRS